MKNKTEHKRQCGTENRMCRKITKNGTEDRTENMIIENKQENVKIIFNAKENRTQKIEYVAKR